MATPRGTGAAVARIMSALPGGASAVGRRSPAPAAPRTKHGIPHSHTHASIAHCRRHGDVRDHTRHAPRAGERIVHARGRAGWWHPTDRRAIHERRGRARARGAPARPRGCARAHRGEDVDPALYGASAHPALGTTHRARDATEIALIHAAHERRTPTLAICRGIQTLNVAFGGTLVQDIPSERQGSLDHDAASNRGSRVHDVEIELGSRLESVLGTSRLRANSFHHQSLDRLGEGLRVTAMAPDGIIEAAEWVRDDWWAVAVQWHPEELCEAPEPWDRSLFRALCDRAASTAVPFAAASASG